ncbi:MAG: hypothetical protein IJB54_03155 [Firmicutes bacterium]|nr:hypothetical protein [Bacillota bacterium]
MNNVEIFVDIKGFEGLYQVSNLGRVKSLGRRRYRKGSIKIPKTTREWHYRERILKPIEMNGRLKVNLHDMSDNQKGASLATLVAVHFLLTDPDKHVTRINFKDGDYHNCCSDNLIMIIK